MCEQVTKLLEHLGLFSEKNPNGLQSSYRQISQQQKLDYVEMSSRIDVETPGHFWFFSPEKSEVTWCLNIKFELKSVWGTVPIEERIIIKLTERL